MSINHGLTSCLAHPHVNTHFPMAYLTHGAGFVPQQAPDPSYTHAVFRAYDDGSSRTAPIGPRDPPAKAFNNPFNNPSQSHIRPLPFPDTRPNATIHQSAIHPSTLEMAEGLIRMRASVEPMSTVIRDQFAHETTPATAANAAAIITTTTNGFMAHAPPLPKNEPESHLTASANPPTRPTVSTSSEENTGRYSDIFSVGETSDTITDPDIDSAERGLFQTKTQAPYAPGRDFIQKTMAVAMQPGANGHSSRPSLPVALPSTASPTQSLDHHVAESPEVDVKHRRLYDPAAPILPILPIHGIQCHCRGVADVFINILDEKTPVDVENLTKLYGMCRDDLCPLHLNAYAKLITNAVEATSVPPLTHPPGQATMTRQHQMDHITYTFDFTIKQTGSGTRWTAVPRRRRATSIPGIDEFDIDLPPKRRRLVFRDSHGPGVLPQPHFKTPPPPPPPPPQHQPTAETSPRPSLDVEFNDHFRRQVLAELAQNFTDKKEDDWSRGETTNRYIHAILSECQPPNTDIRNGPIDAGFLRGDEAAEVIENGIERLPIFTEGQQQFQWSDKARPIAQLFRRMEDLTREVSVQIPSHNFDLPSYETKSLTDIRDRFLNGNPSQDPWNILDLRSPLPPAILPKFLTGENCQLLPRIRDALLEGHSAERTKASREEWNEWTELLEWVLMSEGGHNTAPHMDSHGWSTWITIQEGHFGFGWLSRPTDKEQDDWMNDPLGYTDGKWCFVILKPGQTVFFPSGTIHFVFRLHNQQTLALGGHLLQWTALERWVYIIMCQLKNPNITNEDLGTAPLKYIRTAVKLAESRMATTRICPMGGIPAITKFLVQANEVERWYSRKKKKRSR